MESYEYFVDYSKYRHDENHEITFSCKDSETLRKVNDLVLRSFPSDVSVSCISDYDLHIRILEEGDDIYGISREAQEEEQQNKKEEHHGNDSEGP